MGSSDARADSWPADPWATYQGQGGWLSLPWPARVSEGRSCKEMQAVR